MKTEKTNKKLNLLYKADVMDLQDAFGTKFILELREVIENHEYQAFGLFCGWLLANYEGLELPEKAIDLDTGKSVRLNINNFDCISRVELYF